MAYFYRVKVPNRPQGSGPLVEGKGVVATRVRGKLTTKPGPGEQKSESGPMIAGSAGNGQRSPIATRKTVEFGLSILFYS